MHHGRIVELRCYLAQNLDDPRVVIGKVGSHIGRRVVGGKEGLVVLDVNQTKGLNTTIG
jgi:hypothetical protein